MNRRAFLVLLSAGAARAAPFWESHKYPNWSDRELDAILTDSPWAKLLRVTFLLDERPRRQAVSFSDVGLPPGVGLPGRIPGWPGGTRFPRPGSDRRPGGAGARAEAFLTLRWSSALPIRQALLLVSTRRNLPPPESEALLEQEPQEYLLELFGLPAQAAPPSTAEWAAALERSAALVRKGGRPIPARSVEIPPYGNHLAIQFRFPRTDPITLQDRQVEFFAAGGPFEFRQVFKLAPMVYEGRLAL
jgi:hypothetical protein